jgi:hypothetical protein
MQKEIVNRIKKVATECYLHMYDVTGNHSDKHNYRECVINAIENKTSLERCGIPKNLSDEIQEICTNEDQRIAFFAFLFTDRTGRTLNEILLDAGLTYQEIEKLDNGEI